MTAEARPTESGHRRSLDCLPENLVERYRAVRALTETLASPLSAEDCGLQSMPDASPVKWHLAHTSWFFETFILQSYRSGYRVFDAQFGYLFNSYYNAVGDRISRSARGLLSRPSLEDVNRYRHHVDEHVCDLLESVGPTKRRALGELIELGLNHEQQHQELILTDIKHALAGNPLRPVYRAREEPPDRLTATPVGWVAFPEDLRWIGHGGDGFAFDNEGPRHRVFVPAFRLASRPVTNGEYQSFIADGGYDRPQFWLSDGWTARVAQGWSEPLYWEQRDGRQWIMTLNGPQVLAARAGLPRQLLRGRCVRPLGRCPPADRGRVGDRGGRSRRARKPPRRQRKSPATDSRPGRCGHWISSSATSGNGP